MAILVSRTSVTGKLCSAEACMGWLYDAVVLLVMAVACMGIGAAIGLLLDGWIARHERRH